MMRLITSADRRDGTQFNTIVTNHLHAHLHEHEVKPSRRENLMTHEAVRVLLHALLLGKCEQLPGHQTQHVELLHIGLLVDADALTGSRNNKIINAFVL